MGAGRRWLIATAAAGLCAASLALPTYSPFNPQFSTTTYSGAHAFELGWQALTEWELTDADWWILAAAWLANPAVWCAIVAAGCGRWRVVGIAAACALALCLPVLLRLPEVLAPNPGCWAWSGSAALLLTVCVLVRCRGPCGIKRRARLLH